MNGPKWIKTKDFGSNKIKFHAYQHTKKPKTEKETYKKKNQFKAQLVQNRSK